LLAPTQYSSFVTLAQFQTASFAVFRPSDVDFGQFDPILNGMISVQLPIYCNSGEDSCNPFSAMLPAKNSQKKRQPICQ